MPLSALEIGAALSKTGKMLGGTNLLTNTLSMQYVNGQGFLSMADRYFHSSVNRVTID